MTLFSLTDYTLAPKGTGNGLKDICLHISQGEAWSVHPDLPDDGRLLLRALATLEYPLKGKYHFGKKIIDFSDYRNLLPFKRRIGYIAPDVSMITVRTVRENLLMMRHYFENMLNLEPDDYMIKLCQMFHISDKLDRRPSELHLMDIRMAITIREIAKRPEILLIERPESFMGHEKFSVFLDILKNDILLCGIPVVFLSYDINLVERFSTKSITIKNGNVL